MIPPRPYTKKSRQGQPNPTTPRPHVRHHHEHTPPTKAEHVHVIPPNPIPVPQPLEEAEESNQTPKSWIAGAVVLVCALGCLCFYFLVQKPQAEFRAEYVEIRSVRNLPGEATVPSLKRVLTPQDLRNIEQEGYGLRLILETREDGKSKGKKEEILVEPNSDADAGKRRVELAKAQTRIESLFQAFNAPYDRVIKYAVFIDSTSGDLAAVKRQLEVQLSPDIVQRHSQKGYTVRVYFHTLSGSSSYSANFYGTVNIPAQSPTGEGQEKIARMRDDLASSLKSSSSSALAAGILGSIQEDGLTDGDHVVVFSDGLEHHRSTFSLESASPKELQDPDNWAAYFKKMEGSVPAMPALQGIQFDWYLPAQEGREEKLSTAVRIWKQFMTQRGASFREHL